MLHIEFKKTIYTYSKGYTIHAGRNLPAKEFRYLRTVRVTAAVYLEFNFVREH
jgi:hypothetical protein